ncbi:MAG: hypothetical protein E7278_02280 [Lachnospiraceae bacterium]|nr:hypothetical protein [Lachnospiraceae bacterium]
MRKKRTQQSEDSNTSISKERLAEMLVKKYPKAAAILICILLTSLGIALGNLCPLLMDLKSLATKDDLARSEERLSERDKSIEDEINKNEDDIQELSATVARMEQKVDDTYQLVYGTSNILSFEEKETFISGVNNWTDETVIGTDVKGAYVYAGDKIEETIIMVYQEENYTVLFCGQYNSDYQWDGYCVTNAYRNSGELYGICESYFINGVRESYSSLVMTEYDNKIMTYSNRTCTTHGNTGYSVDYQYSSVPMESDCGLDTEHVDILYVYDVLNCYKDRMVRYYSGITIDEKYEDSSGEAYLIEYDKEGAVQLLYRGGFKNGMPSDSTGKAFSIVYDELGYGVYFYNKGVFSNGKANKKGTNPLTKDDIDNIVEKYSFSSPLKWKEEAFKQ